MKTFVQVTIILAMIAGGAVNASAAVKSRRNSKQAAVEKFDRSAIIYNKCVEIEKLSKKHSAMKCMDRFLDRMDVQVNEIETRLVSCEERRRIEDLDNGEHIRQVVTSELAKLRAIQADDIQANYRQIRSTGESVGPRKMKEIELRAAEKHSGRAKKLAKLVCSRPAFNAFMKRR